MKDALAFITGIEAYTNAKWNVAGPARTAVDYALWLEGRDLPADRIYLFLSIARDLYQASELAQLDQDVAALKAKGAQIRGATKDELYAFSRGELLGLQAAKLFAFWTGHGGNTARNERVFYCQDYPTLPYKLMDWGKLLECLRFQAPPLEQFVLADVCGVYLPSVNSPEAAEQYNPRKGTAQEAFYATLDGEYAEGKALGGEFSARALALLKQMNGWPDPAEFCRKILKVSPKTPFVFSADTSKFSLGEVRVGGAAAIGELARGALQLLQAANRPESEFRPVE